MQDNVKYGANTDKCTIVFEVDEDIKGEVWFYYQLENFNQNHRGYVKSMDWRQLAGKEMDYSDVKTSCYPMTNSTQLKKFDGKTGQTLDGKPFV